MASKYAGSDAAVADANAGNTVAPITPEQQASIDQAKAQDRQAMASSDDTYIKAARQTGYIEPKDVLSNATRAELGQLKADTYRESMQNKADIADAKGDIALQIAAMRNGGSQEPKITPTQKMHNFEIDKAREIVASLSPDEIKKKTAKFTNTGRENPDFDPNLANRVRIASKRKVGDDPEFDQVQSPTTATTGNDVQTRFTSDSAMKGYKLGQQDANGYQVLDANGKLLGHYK
jgi:hypothetical protein